MTTRERIAELLATARARLSRICREMDGQPRTGERDRHRQQLRRLERDLEDVAAGLEVEFAPANDMLGSPSSLPSALRGSRRARAGEGVSLPALGASRSRCGTAAPDPSRTNQAFPPPAAGQTPPPG